MLTGPNFMIGQLDRILASDEREFHSAISIQLGELIEWGWVKWDDPTWHWDAYNDEQYERLCKKIEDRYWFREIGILPPGQWKREYLRKLNEIMPKYKILYKMIDDNGINIMQDGDEYHKERDVFSEFPQTRLAGDQDYASNGTDKEYEHLREGSTLDKLEQFARRYRDVDVMILDDLEVLFSSLSTVSLNGY